MDAPNREKMLRFQMSAAGQEQVLKLISIK